MPTRSPLFTREHIQVLEEALGRDMSLSITIRDREAYVEVFTGILRVLCVYLSRESEGFDQHEFVTNVLKNFKERL